MQIHINKQNNCLSKEIALNNELDGFYVACAKIVDGNLVYYACTDEKWADEYIRHFKNDPIVGKKRINNKKLTITAWEYPLSSNADFEFFKKREAMTNATFGLTAFRGIKSESGETVYEFFALGSRNPEQKKKMLNRDFTHRALKEIFNAFEKE